MNDSLERKPMRVNGQGMLETFIALAAMFGDRTVGNAFGALRDSQITFGAGVDATFGWFDRVQTSSTELTRRAARRFFDFNLDALDFGEQSLLSVIGALRATGQEATALALETADTIATGPRDIRAAS